MMAQSEIFCKLGSCPWLLTFAKQLFCCLINIYCSHFKLVCVIVATWVHPTRRQNLAANISATSETLSYRDHYFWRSFHGQRRRNANNDISLSPWKQNLTRNRFNKNPRAFIFSTSCRPRHKLGALLSRGSHVPQSCLSISKISSMKYWLALFVHFWYNVICKMLFIVGMIYSSSSGCWAC